jgi:hypothetical protein
MSVTYRARLKCRVLTLGAVLLVTASSVLVLADPAQAGPTYRFVAGYRFPSGTPWSVSCRSTDNCLVVGGDLAETWNGQTVTSIAGLDGPGPAGDSHAWDAASCTPSGACMIVGSDGVRGRSAYRTSSTGAWHRASIPAPPDLGSGGRSGRYHNVSCSSASYCLAVGFYFPTSASVERGLLMRWDGAAWHPGQLSPSVPTGGDVNFFDVSCAADAQCLLVGARDVGTGADATMVAFRAVLNDTVWQVANLPGAGSAFPLAGAVSCWAVQRCTVVATGSSNRVWKWTGGSTFSSLPAYGNPDLWVNRLSCTSASFCVAANDTSDSIPAVYRWDGSTWTFVGIHIAKVGQPTIALPTGVSCTATLTCTLVGFDMADYPGGDSGAYLDTLQAT